jgi:hypothetical protein
MSTETMRFESSRLSVRPASTEPADSGGIEIPVPLHAVGRQRVPDERVEIVPEKLPYGQVEGGFSDASARADRDSARRRA